VPYQAAEQFGIFGQLAQLNLNEGKALLKRGELLEELFLGGFLFRGNALAFVVSVDETYHDDAPLFRAKLGRCLQLDLRQGAGIDTRFLFVGATVARPERPRRRLDAHSTTSSGFRVTGLDML
jgi:hypothetical protein